MGAAPWDFPFKRTMKREITLRDVIAAGHGSDDLSEDAIVIVIQFTLFSLGQI